MNKINEKILLSLLYSTFFILNGCTDKFDFGSISNSKTTDNSKVVRGPSGVGSGGGVIIVEKNGTVQPDKKYEIFIVENGIKLSLQNGTTDKEGKVQLSESKLSSERIRRIQDGSAKLIVEVYDGNVKTAAGGRIIVQTENGRESEIDLGNA